MMSDMSECYANSPKFSWYEKKKEQSLLKVMAKANQSRRQESIVWLV